MFNIGDRVRVLHKDEIKDEFNSFRYKYCGETARIVNTRRRIDEIVYALSFSNEVYNDSQDKKMFNGNMYKYNKWCWHENQIKPCNNNKRIMEE